MRNRLRWTRTVLAVLVAASLLGLPQIASGGDRCARRSYDYGRDNRVYYDGQDYSYGYRDYAGAYGGYYPNTTYRNSGYRNDGYYGDYGYRDNRYYGDGYGYYGNRAAGRSAAIIGGSAATGAIIGGLAGGGKGAAIGAAVDGIGGLIFDRSTRRDRDRW
jgi:hypothetical protein